MKSSFPDVERAAALVSAALLVALCASGCEGARAPLQVVPADGAGARVVGSAELRGAFTGTGNEEYASLRTNGLAAELAVTTPEGLTVGAYPVGLPRLLDNVDTVRLVDTISLGYGRRDGLILVVQGGRDGLVMQETQILGLRTTNAEVLWSELNCGSIAESPGAIGVVECEGFEGQARPEFPWERSRWLLTWQSGGIQPERLLFECTESVTWGDFRALGEPEPAALQECSAGLFAPAPGVLPAQRDPSWPTRQVALLWRGQGEGAAPTQVESWIHFGDEFRDYGLVGTVRQGIVDRDAVVLHVAEQRRDERSESLMVMAWDAPANGFRDQMAWHQPAREIEVLSHDESGLRIRWVDPPPGATHTGWLRYTPDGQVVMPAR